MRLNVEFMSSGRSSMTARGLASKEADKSLFWWVIVITLLLGGAIASWFFSLFIFSYPERSWNYNFLQKINRLEPLVKWQVQAGDKKTVPAGKFHGPREAYQEFDRLSDENLQAKSALLKRSYIMNYVNPDEKPVYVKGRFRIYHVRPLTGEDIFTRGIVVRAQALDILEDGREEEFPNTLIEFVFPTEGTVPAAFNVNDVLAIDLTKDKRSYASVINIERLSGQKLLFTVVPLLYGKYDVNKEAGVQITLEPPKSLNMNGRWPITEETVGSAAPPTARVVAEADTNIGQNGS